MEGESQSPICRSTENKTVAPGPVQFPIDSKALREYILERKSLKRETANHLAGQALAGFGFAKKGTPECDIVFGIF